MGKFQDFFCIFPKYSQNKHFVVKIDVFIKMAKLFSHFDKKKVILRTFGENIDFPQKFP